MVEVWVNFIYFKAFGCVQLVVVCEFIEDVLEYFSCQHLEVIEVSCMSFVRKSDQKLDKVQKVLVVGDSKESTAKQRKLLYYREVQVLVLKLYVS